jgi:uncharacterized protein YndB with AHSA1/START domain
MNSTDPKDTALSTERIFSASPREIFDAFEQPEKLAKWWGPAGFTNTFETFEFKPGGRWIYVMHGPDGRDYANECTFREIEPNSNIVIDHISLPKYTLTINLTADCDQTHLTWVQEFENLEFASRMRDFLTNANGENLDRLEVVLGESVA